MNKLCKYIKGNGISQRFFAKKLGITPNYLGRLIAGIGIPSLKLAHLIQEYTQGIVPMDDWLDNIENSDSSRK